MNKRRHRLIRSALLIIMLMLASTTSTVTAAEHTITTTQNNAFSPPTLEIAPGDIVTWTNGDGFHNVISADPALRCANGCDGGDGSPASNAWTFSLIFNTGRTVDYACEIHQGGGMTGTVTVTGIFGSGFETGDFAEWNTVVP